MIHSQGKGKDSGGRDEEKRAQGPAKDRWTGGPRENGNMPMGMYRSQVRKCHNKAELSQ